MRYYDKKTEDKGNRHAAGATETSSMSLSYRFHLRAASPPYLIKQRSKRSRGFSIAISGLHLRACRSGMIVQQ